MTKRPREPFPYMSAHQIKKKYPDMMTNYTDYWFLWLEDFVWNKTVNTLTISQDKLDKASIRAAYIENSAAHKIIIVKSETTGNFFPFDFVSSNPKVTAFKRMDPDCPISHLFFER